jgi:hypothetical protein
VPFAVTARSMAWIFGRSLAEIAGWKPVGDMEVCLSVVSFASRQVEFSAASLSLVRRSPTECGVSECGLWASRAREEAWPTMAVEPCGKEC